MNNDDRKKFDKIENILLSHGERLARIEEQNRNQYKILTQIQQQLFGNGQEGLVKTVARHKTYFVLMGSAITIIAGVFIKLFL